jgi:GMP synthase (glutamine-hydrolysing)
MKPGAPGLTAYVLESELPVLGICYGMQLLTDNLGGRVAPAQAREYGPASIETTRPNPLLPPGSQPVWMSHGDRIEALPPGFAALAASPNSPFAAMGDARAGALACSSTPKYTIPRAEKRSAPLCGGCVRRPAQDWTPESIITASVERMRAQVGSERVLSAVSGGVDSSVATALVHRAIGDQLSAVFVDTGMLRQGEREQVRRLPRKNLGVNLVVVNAVEEFLDALDGVTEPETKRASSARPLSASSKPKPAAWASRASWCRAPSTPMWSNRARPTATRPSASRPITTWAGCPKI